MLTAVWSPEPEPTMTSARWSPFRSAAATETLPLKAAENGASTARPGSADLPGTRHMDDRVGLRIVARRCARPARATSGGIRDRTRLDRELSRVGVRTYCRRLLRPRDRLPHLRAGGAVQASRPQPPG